MNQLTEYRREFHKYPENGWREFRTSARVAEILTGMGYDVAMGPDVIEPGSVGEPERLSEEQIRQEMERAVRQGADPAFVKRTQGWPGVMAVLDTGREGPVSAMRFEMDCLPYDEPQRPGYRPCDEGYLSCNPQSVHACGHDGHTAIGLGIAAELMKRKGELKGKIKLFFQPAEETFYGAQSIVDKGHLDDVMNFIAVHIALSAENKPLPSHTVAWVPGFPQRPAVGCLSGGKGRPPLRGLPRGKERPAGRLLRRIKHPQHRPPRGGPVPGECGRDPRRCVCQYHCAGRHDAH